MASSDHPYRNLPACAFWRTAISDHHFSEISDLAKRIEFSPKEKVATAGSCFAQHIGRALRTQKLNYLDLEPAPAALTPTEAQRHGFGIYSCRYGNIYTVRQLLQLTQEALGERTPQEIVWSKDGRYYDALRPSVDPVGHDQPDCIGDLRAQHLRRVRELLSSLDVFVFTLGLTEAWALTNDGTVFPNCPGTGPGVFDSAKYNFHNFRYPEIWQDLTAFRERLKSINSRARLLLTVSPVSLTATASGQHVLPATTYSKATLRAVAGDMASSFKDVSYFPSYEIIASHPFRGTFFNPDLRTVNEMGVRLVMQHFFQAMGLSAAPSSTDYDKLGVVCDEEKLAAFAVD